MENREIAISLRGVKKQYTLGQIGGGSLQQELQSWWAKVRGREDPNTRIGMQSQLLGQKFWALDGIDLTVYKGEALGIIGGNGAGKSTMLKLLSRITAPTEGEIDLYGRVSSMLEVGTGFNNQMTGRENIYLNGAILGMTREEIEEKLEDIIAFSEVREFIDTPVKRYSSGMFVKLAFAVSAHLNSEIMIMDEVLAVGDMAFQKKCLDKMREAAQQEGRTVLYVSHNMNTIRQLCDRCIVLDHGRIIFDGDVEQAISVYMNHSTGEAETDMDLTQKPHAKADIDLGLTMERLILVDKAFPTYEDGEPLKMRFFLRVTRPLERVQLRVSFRTQTDQPLGTTWSTPIDFSHTGVCSVDFECPLELLTVGTLYCSIGFNVMDDYGRMTLLDHITRAFRIELQSKLGIRNWSVEAYGHVHFPDMVSGSVDWTEQE